MNVRELSKFLKDDTTILALFDVLFLALPGVLILYVLQRETFMSLDWVKLILLAMSFVLPVAFFNTLFMMWSFEGTALEGSMFAPFSLGLIFTALIYFMALGATYVPLSYIQNFFLSTAIFELLFLVVVIHDKITRREK